MFRQVISTLEVTYEPFFFCPACTDTVCLKFSSLNFPRTRGLSKASPDHVTGLLIGVSRY